MATTSFLGQELGDFLDLVASREAAPGGGAVAAVTISLAAGLVAMAAQLSERQLPDSASLVTEAEQVRRRSERLADEDAEAYRAVLAAYTAARSGATAKTYAKIAAALDGAARVPLEMASLAAQTAVLGARLALEGNPRLRGDATTAVLLAEAAARSAAHLVQVDVDEGDGDPALIREAEDHVRAASVAVASLPRHQ
ncbi:MAG: methenyltetrahydrofolate cyclohydrolase [Nocardioidaceae bacterium]|jgi:formiminotetrahydrofolate cyclodeaminase|nr:methenyltetrahydrofolate cyclohydrolase [Nocardioidaceae bacterium]